MAVHVAKDVALLKETLSTLLSVYISEERDHFKIEIAVPGIVKGNFKLDLDHKVLTISYEKKSEEEKKDKKYTRRV